MSANDDTYAYDSRGNITSKTESGTTTTFTYSNSGWKDQLVSVNGVDLTYDANGNVLTYGDKDYTWNSGRNLESIVDGDNEYSYTYDENGIRTSKTVNGKTTYYNTKDGVILSQTDGTSTWYFQYDTNGSPLGFVLNGTQYFYITNQMGYVLAITDTNGDIVANYEYDAWGKVLTADTNIAKQNPLRYRGYYYDNETGYYYLQSRYYDANIFRFINSDSFLYAIIHKNNTSGVNLYVYCFNNSINNSDNNGFSAALAGSALFYYFVNYVLPEIIAYGILIISGVLLTYLLIKVVADALNNSNSSGSSSNSPKKPKKPKKPHNSKIQKILDKIPNSLKKNGKVDLSKFDRPVKGKTAWKSSNGWKIEKDTANHGGRVWKLFNKAGKRIASLGADGSVLAD